ncbi:HNH endonuclease signature motif containing protein [Mycobacterium sp.]|uniref:HNH endonuclease signature motif containing protein n=1 Tax=Mycobacterium sp. TaxID=1785 RepID=UPI003F9758AC
MSPRARKICGAPQCPKLAEVGSRYCLAHRREKQWAGSDKKRSGTADHRNRQARIFANAGYRCEIQWEGCTFTAEVLDHIIALGLGGADDTDANYQASCVKCSSTKASIEAHLASGHAVEMPAMRRHGVLAAAVVPKFKAVGIPKRIETIL